MSPSTPGSELAVETNWFHEGLRFACTRCGACCTGSPGFVWVNAEEIAQLAAFRGESIDDFSRAYVRRVGSRYSLKEKRGGDCVFWDKGAGCTVYEARPIQCQTWPFWPENIKTSEEWEHVRQICPGSGHGPLFSVEEIRAAAARVHTV